MEAFSVIKPYDMVILGITAVLVGRGIYLGLLRQVTGLLALYLGYWAAGQYHERLFPMLKDLSSNPKIVFLACYVILFVATYVVVMLLGKALSHVISMTITGWFDRVLGGLVGFAKAAIVVVLIHIILGSLIVPENTMLRTCASCDVLNSAADFSRQVIRSEEVRRSLVQQEPAIALDAVKNYIKKATASENSGKRSGAN